MSIKLNNGIEIPQIGFGCWKVEKSICAQQIYEAIKAGYRLFDGAMDYGNEKEIGDGIQLAIKDGLVKREELFIVSKLWNNYHDPKSVKLAINKVLSDLKLDYLDIFYIHFPIAFKFVPFEEKYPPGFYCGDGDKFIYEDVSLAQTWAALENLVEEGLVKSIGISNFSGALIQDLLRTCKIKPALLQIEHHPYLVQEKLIEYTKSQGINIVAYSSFGPQSFVELDHPAAQDSITLFKHETVTKIASNHSVSPAKVLLRWSTQRGLLIIPKSNQKERLLANLKINDFDLTQEELDAISSLDKGLRFNDPWNWNKIPTFI
ncbi:hypothetical protein CANARDRAFT_100586 [[Candida] arabinofermentans NRRL YB-2248]|uniref:NADP-dependent oxidoreductase domain-containing protein n=1 Tax=[Candida] arabinofermentans NRRL YB-2248 TaxID=983967 RepID=A0A1E4SUQ0_9ASCO|nr:hypothetical protein CANARDRAFT_100586 [[Candida] arabinofermentans NRRL YB-2248]